MNDLDPERALIGIILDRPKLIRDVEDVEPHDFHDPRLEALWGLMLWLDQNRMPPQPALVFSHLSRIDIPIEPTLITDLYGQAPPGGLARLYADRVINTAILRRLHEAGTRIAHLTEPGATLDAQELQEEARAQIDKASRHVSELTTIDQTIDSVIDSLEGDAPNYTPTPWADLNHILGGWRPGGLYIVGARPGVGKSILGKQAAVALSRIGWTAMFSLEMPKAEVDTRVLAELAEVSLTRMQQKTLNQRDWEHIARARSDISTLKLAIDDRGALRMIDIRSYVRTLARRGPLAGIVLDYIQLMQPNHGERRPRHEVVGEWSRELKLLAKDLNIPVIVLAQLNRGSVGRTDPRPTMADLRESGSLEQDADAVILLHVDEDKDPSALLFGVPKHRHGITGAGTLVRKGEFARLDDERWSPVKAAR